MNALQVLATIVLSVTLAAALAFWAFSISDLLRSDARKVRGFPREFWLAIVVFGSVVGCLAWWIIGRPRRG